MLYSPYPHPRFLQEIERSGGHLPRFVRQEFEDYLKCGLLEHGFLPVKCDGRLHEHLVAFSCKHRGFCPSCGARRMVESAAHLIDHVFPEVAVRQYVLTFPFPLRFLLAANPQALSQVLAVVQRGISTFVIHRAGLTLSSGARTGAVTLVQRFGSALTLYSVPQPPRHFHADQPPAPMSWMQRLKRVFAMPQGTLS